MSKYKKKPVVIGATQWFKNGDHPLDNDPQHEGEIVRYFRKPDVSGSATCPQCGEKFHSHGWIDTLEDGGIVCPGDWIINDAKGEFYPCKPDIFKETYDLIGE